MAGPEPRTEAPVAPVARVLPMLGLAHLDRTFDYRVDTATDAAAQPGVRVRVRFAGRRVDGFLLERRETTDHVGKLAWLDRVVSPEPVLSEPMAKLCRAVADRYGGTMADVLRLAVPPRHARVEKANPPPACDDVIEVPDLVAWRALPGGDSFLEALTAGGTPRAAWQVPPGEDWAAALAELAAATAAEGRGVLIVVPDQRDLDRLEAACAPLLGGHCVTLAAGLGPTARYRRWLAVLRGQARVVLGTRSAMFAPVRDLGLVVVFDDGDDSLAEPRSPYPHPREVAVLRSHLEATGLVIGGIARTTEAQALVSAGWAHDLVADRTVVRERMPRISGLSDDDRRVARDPLARAARIPGIAFAAVRAALDADQPALFSVPRRGYVPSVACADCRSHARCRACAGPLELGERGDLGCRWCGRPETRFVCPNCGCRRVRALTVGQRRTAEELGRAFPGVPVVTSGGDHIVDEVEDGARIVVATPGAEPRAEPGYGAAVIVDTWAQLDREDLRAEEKAVRQWLAVAALVRSHGDGGQVIIVADAGLTATQALIRWDPVGYAIGELGRRAELGFPPAVSMAAVDGPAGAVGNFVDSVRLPAGGQVLGPVPLPPGVRAPAGAETSRDLVRMLLRVERTAGRELAQAISAAQVLRHARHEDTAGIRVQIDPPTIG